MKASCAEKGAPRMAANLLLALGWNWWLAIALGVIVIVLLVYRSRQR